MADKLQKIKALLKQKNLTYAKFAALIGKSEPTVRNWFKGTSKIDIDTIEKIAQVLGVPVSYFFDETGSVIGGQVVNAGNIVNGNVKQVIAHNHELEIEVERLRAELEGCRELLKAKDEIIAVLKERGTGRG